MNDQALAIDPTVLSRREIEPVQFAGSIQPHGALLAFDLRDLRVVHAGGDTNGLLGAPPAALLGRRAAEILSADHFKRLHRLLAPDRAMTRPLHAFTMGPRRDGSTTDVVMHQGAGLLTLEFEPRRESEPENPLALVQNMMWPVQQAKTAQALCEAAAKEIRALTGFDRAIVYQFMPDGGDVKAESRRPDIDSFLGVQYPESEIPRPARPPDLTNWIRMIPDARYAPAPILPPVNPADGRPLNLGQSILRSVSPVHRQYLANIGVVAAMSLSLIVRGQLWGLIACHHHRPRYLSYRLRESCKLFAEMVSAQLEIKIAAEQFEARLRNARLHGEILMEMSRAPDLLDGLIRLRQNLLDLIPAAGVGLWVEGRFAALGAAPPADEIKPLVSWLNASTKDGVFCTDCLPLFYPRASKFVDAASGLLALSLSRTPRDYVLWFRPEVVRIVTWPGDPDAPKEPGPHGDAPGGRRYAPRRESVRLHSSPWLAAEREAADRLWLSLLEVVRRSDQVACEREAARLKQEELMQELDRQLLQSRAGAYALQREAERCAGVEAELSQVLRRTVTIQEAERLRIARDLHDTLGQSLTLLQLGLDGIGRAASAGADIQKRLADAKALAGDIGREINRLVWEIRPPAFDEFGIETAIRNLVDTFSERSNVQFDLQLMLGKTRLPPAVETTLYRVLREALTNVVRHSAAKRVSVVVRLAGDCVTLIVEDDGRGFDLNDAEFANPAKRLGLLGIHERLSLVGGSLEVETAPGDGVTLYVKIPV
jgi:light-regulated signal transduction histidine kinase (bacteriophytochrome)